ncbi:male sterility protein-domain-containing protein [Mycena olivaceomarginata]|nr:male sterility protein-domain-containing protein [Mycena olivaceomarginata]
MTHVRLAEVGLLGDLRSYKINPLRGPLRNLGGPPLGEEIEDLYDTIEASGNAASNIDPPASWSAQDLEPWLRTHASLVSGRDVRAGQDLFDQGLDSLSATFLRHRIVGALKSSDDDQTKRAAEGIVQNFVYANPSIEELGRAIATLVHGNADSSGTENKGNVERMIVKYSEGLEAATNPDGKTAILGKRPVSERQREAFLDRALDVTLLSTDKLVYLEGDTAKEDLGLPPHIFTALRDIITVIIHNAWTLDFNRSLSSFEPHVKGMHNLIDLARRSQRSSGVRFLFTSSIATAQNWDPKRGPFPEELQLDASLALGNGYGESKYVSERILAASRLEATSFRIGQVCGSTSNGAWSTTDWVPTIVKSSIALGNFPSDPSGVVAWLPPEAVSRCIVDVALSAEKPPFAINLVHPRPIPWDFVMSAMAATVQLPLIPFPDWVGQLQARSAKATAEDIAKIPGIKLLDFFKAAVAGKGTAEFSTLKAQAISESMKLLKPLTEDDAKQWMAYWKKEFLA